MENYLVVKNLLIRVNRSGYEIMRYPKPNRIHTILEDGVVDDGAQVVMFSPSIAMRLGIRRGYMINMDVELKTAGGESLKVVGGIPIILTINLEDIGEGKKICQMET